MNFFVPGTPVAKGSAKAFYNKKLGRTMVIQSNVAKQKPWASMISVMAQNAGICLSTLPCRLTLKFCMPRPKAHFRSNGSEKDSAPVLHTKKPDLDKLIRCVKDALTGVAYHDDSQVFEINAIKVYANHPGCMIEIEECPS